MIDYTEKLISYISSSYFRTKGWKQELEYFVNAQPA